MKIGIVGATGAVGRAMLSELAKQSWSRDISKLRLFASPKSAGAKLEFLGKQVEVEAFALDHMRGLDFVLMSAGGAFSKENSKQISEAGPIIVDNSSAWRMHKDVPLVVPEVNGTALKNFRKGIIANPNCSTIQLVVALAPLEKAFGLESVQVATYQSVSGAGQKGIEELKGQMTAWAKGEAPKVTKFATPIVANLIPAIDTINVETGHAYEEEKMVQETRKIMSLPDLPVMATTVRVPTFNCHGEAVTVELNKDVSLQDAERVFSGAAGVVFSPKHSYDALWYPRDICGKGEVFVGRVRLPLGQQRSRFVQFWNIADNLMKGAATNAVQIIPLLR